MNYLLLIGTLFLPESSHVFMNGQYSTSNNATTFSFFADNKHRFKLTIFSKTIVIEPNDADIMAEYDLKPGSWHLIRPDHYIAARGRQINMAEIEAAL
jgi:hypothetical protein